MHPLNPDDFLFSIRSIETLYLYLWLFVVISCWWVHVFVVVCVSVCKYVCVCVFACMYVGKFGMYVCVCVRMYLCVYMCMYWFMSVSLCDYQKNVRFNILCLYLCLFIVLSCWWAFVVLWLLVCVCMDGNMYLCMYYLCIYSFMSVSLCDYQQNVWIVF